MGSDKYEMTLEQAISDYEESLAVVKTALEKAENALTVLKAKLKEVQPAATLEQTL